MRVRPRGNVVAMRAARATFLDWLDRQGLPHTEPYPCPYVPGLTARQRGFAADRLDPELYHELMDRGFRRSGDVFYAMDCPDCRRCVPLRVPVDGFRPSRSQRRTLRRNADVAVVLDRPRFHDETFALYRRYLRHQHPGSPDDESAERFRAALYAEVVDSLEARYLLDGRLVGVSLLDVSRRSWSSVYHFFDPVERRRRIGVLSALREIELARAHGVPFYYLGYWIADARTMRYKAEFRPHELLRDGVWKRDGR